MCNQIHITCRPTSAFDLQKGRTLIHSLFEQSHPEIYNLTKTFLSVRISESFPYFFLLFISCPHHSQNLEPVGPCLITLRKLKKVNAFKYNYISCWALWCTGRKASLMIPKRFVSSSTMMIDRSTRASLELNRTLIGDGIYFFGKKGLNIVVKTNTCNF